MINTFRKHPLTTTAWLLFLACLCTLALHVTLDLDLRMRYILAIAFAAVGIGCLLWLRHYSWHLLVVTLLLFGAVAFYNPVRFNIWSFHRGADAALTRARDLAERAPTFDQDAVLQALPASAINPAVFRLDAHLADAVPTVAADAVQSALVHPGPTLRASDLTKLDTPDGRYYVTPNPLALDKARVEEIHVTIAAPNGGALPLLWSPDADCAPQDALPAVTIPVSPQADTQIYRVRAQTALTAPVFSGTEVNRLVLGPIESNLVLDSLRIVLQQERYLDAPYGTGYESVQDEWRPGLYMRAPLSLAFKVDVPANAPRFDCGVAVVAGDTPIAFSVTVESTPLANIAVQTDAPWRNERIDLSAWAGQSITLHLHTEGEGVIFVSDPVVSAPPKNRFNVVFVLEDTLRADHLSSYGYHRDTDPYKKSLLDRGIRFDHAFSQATMTRPSCPSLMTSLYPTATGVWSFNDRLDDRYLTLAEILHAQGFATLARVQNRNAGYFAGLHQGYGTFFDAYPANAKPASLYAEGLFAWIEDHQDRNFFMYLHVTDPHGPYDPPEHLRDWYASADRATPAHPDPALDADWTAPPTKEGRIALYDGEIRHNDTWFERLMSELETNGIANDTLVIVVSDHGEQFGEHNQWDHHPPSFKQVIHVPLLMFYPNRWSEGRAIKRPVQMLDVMPTVLDLAGIPTESLLLQGQSLVSFADGTPNPAWNDRLAVVDEVSFRKKGANVDWASVIHGPWHFLNSDRTDRTELFGNVDRYPYAKDMLGPRVFDYWEDPSEEDYTNSFYADPFLKRTLRRFIRDLQAANMAIAESFTAESDQDVLIDKDTQDQLEALGYLD
jgi:arylsulfatase A-like enzyme